MHKKRLELLVFSNSSRKYVGEGNGKQGCDLCLVNLAPSNGYVWKSKVANHVDTQCHICMDREDEFLLN
jgi:hypothetical protein